jgi:hypothetical protein
VLAQLRQFLFQTLESLFGGSCLASGTERKAQSNQRTYEGHKSCEQQEQFHLFSRYCINFVEIIAQRNELRSEEMTGSTVVFRASLTGVG